MRRLVLFTILALAGCEAGRSDLVSGDQVVDNFNLALGRIMPDARHPAAREEPQPEYSTAASAFASGADRLAAQITIAAGGDPVRAAQCFCGFPSPDSALWGRTRQIRIGCQRCVRPGASVTSTAVLQVWYLVLGSAKPDHAKGLFMRFLPIVVFIVFGACTPVVMQTSAPRPISEPLVQSVPPQLSQRQAVDNFALVVRRVEPVAEQFCRQRAPQLNCDFLIVVDDRPGQPVNAYQTLDRNGRPIIAFTIPMIAEARNADEIAFVMAHEAAHHIAGHIARQQQNAVAGAVLMGALAGVLGGSSPEAIDNAQRLGATVGARSYSKDFELEADALGTRIAAAAGFDPLKGAAFFFRIPDPGDRFLGTHPANADRLRTVERVAASL